jgi:hypothetical protein
LNLLQTGDGAIWLYDVTELQLRPAVSRGWLAQSEAGLANLGESLAMSVYHTGQAYRTPAQAQDAQLPLEPQPELPAGWGGLGGTRAMIGTLSNKQGVMIKLVGLDPYAHWNYAPAAADSWAFLSHYRRDLTTGKLLVTK